MGVNFIEMIAGMSVETAGLEEGLRKGEELAEKFGDFFAQKAGFEPQKAIDDLGKLTRAQLEQTADALGKQATLTQQAYHMHIASSAQLKVALNEQLRVTDELIEREVKHLALTKAGSVAHLETSQRIQELTIKSKELEGAIEKIGITSKVVFGAMLGVVTLVVGVIGSALMKTVEWGEELEVLGGRLGMSATEAGTFIGVMERFGIQTNVAVRSLTAMEREIVQTQNSLDPLNTKMGNLLGTLRKTNGEAMNMSEVFDLARQKVLSTSDETQRMQIGLALGGQRVLTVLKLSNEEWDKQKASVTASLGPVERAAAESLAYKEAVGQLEQTFRGLQITMGTKLLPILTDTIRGFADLVAEMKKAGEESPRLAKLFSEINPLKAISEGFKTMTLVNAWIDEKLGAVPKGTTDALKNMDKLAQAQKDKALADEEQEKKNKKKEADQELALHREQQMVALSKENVELSEKANKIGIGTLEQTKEALEHEQAKLAIRRHDLEAQLAGARGGNDPDALFQAQVSLRRNEIETAELVSRYAENRYKDEEQATKALGAWNIGAEINLLQRKLNDERIQGDTRLALEAEIYEKRKAYAESAIKIARDLGFASIDQEISYRKGKAAELLGKGDVIGAGGEIVKARQLAIQQADSSLDLLKKFRIVSMQDDIEYQKSKLALVKGNAEEEMKILNNVAALDKQLYDARLTYSLNYTQKTLAAYLELQKITGTAATEAHKPGEQNTFEQAGRDTERQLVDTARTLRDVGEHGGTDESRASAVKTSQAIFAQIEEAQKTGQKISEGLKIAGEAAKVVLERASGGRIRKPGELSSDAENLSKQIGINASEIPRLDTSFVDMATNLRDVLLGAIPNIQAFSDSLAAGTKQISAVTGFVPNKGLGPGGDVTTGVSQGNAPLATGGGAAPPPQNPNLGVGGNFTRSDGSGAAVLSGGKDIASSLKEHSDSLTAALKDHVIQQNQALLDSLNTALANNQQSINITVDPDSGNIMAEFMAKQLA